MNENQPQEDRKPATPGVTTEQPKPVNTPPARPAAPPDTASPKNNA